MAREIHYEVFRRVGARGGWTLHEVMGDRTRALNQAKELMATDQATGVKVIKETYNEESGDYLTLKIFEDGRNEMKESATKEEPPQALPCFKPDDLYSYHSRQTMGRLFVDFLSRNKVTITELIHRADLLEKLEATGTVYQHAVQKIAVAQASSTAVPVQQIMKSLNELATQALQRVYRDQKKGLFPNPHAHQFTELATELAGQGDAAYLFNGALANHLKDAEGWNAKVLTLLQILQKAPAEDAPRALVLSSIDAIMAEILTGSAALHELIGGAENLAEALTCLVELFLGNATGGNQEGLAPLATRFTVDELPEARTAIAGRIVAEFKSAKGLCPNSLVEELKALRRLANRVVMGIGKYLSHEDLIEAFTLRSKRLVTQESISAYLADCQPDEKLERLLFVEENIIGIENKRQLANFVLPVMSSAAFDNFFQNSKVPALSRLQRLAQLQSRVRRTSFVDVQRDEIAQKLDRLAWDVAARNRLFEGLEAKNRNSVEKVQTLLKLTTSGFFTEGQVMARVRDMVLMCLTTPGFLTSYFAGQPASDAGMAALMVELNKVGITDEMGLSLMAA
ncbi:MAG TPA: hypothetical protein VHX92_00050 [Rhizomicrobium sp.]|jgi:hypothetical protein|nr:hypothetical protein [Rhizomicrobium sp.]